MAFLPLTIVFIFIFLFSIVWGWEGEEMRQMFAVISSFFLFPVWLSPFYTMNVDSGIVSFISTPNWLPTYPLDFMLFWNVVLMYWTGVHLFETLGRQDPVAKGLKRLRKER